MSKKVTLGICSFVVASWCSGSALAGGLERSGYNVDLLFDPGKAAAEAGVVLVNPERRSENTQDTLPDNGLGTNGFGGGTKTASDAEDYADPRFGVKLNIFERVDCLADYSRPFGAHSAPGKGWVGAQENVETRVDSYAVSGTCSYSMDAGRGDLRFIGGFIYEEVSGFKESLVAPPPFATGTRCGTPGPQR